MKAVCYLTENLHKATHQHIYSYICRYTYTQSHAYTSTHTVFSLIWAEGPRINHSTRPDLHERLRTSESDWYLVGKSNILSWFKGLHRKQSIQKRQHWRTGSATQLAWDVVKYTVENFIPRETAATHQYKVRHAGKFTLLTLGYDGNTFYIITPVIIIVIVPDVQLCNTTQRAPTKALSALICMVLNVNKN